jgi:hypothetical protein
LSLLKLSYWNGLARAHLSEVIMVLTATLLVLMDEPVREILNRVFRPKSRFLRFLVFVALCSFGYAALAIGTARCLRWLLSVHKGAYMAPIALTILIGAGIVAARRKLI